jgi:hypothetical protein
VIILALPVTCLKVSPGNGAREKEAVKTNTSAKIIIFYKGCHYW